MKELLEHALAGTASHPPGDALATPVDGLFTDGNADGVEMRLLLRSGALAAYRRAGALAQAERHPLPDPAAVEDLAVCSTPVADALGADILSGEYIDVLPEVIGLLARAGRRVPPAILPRLLDRKDASLLPDVAQVVGKRGAWLARLRKEWEWILREAPHPSEDERLWHEGTPALRLGALCRRRGPDPEGARAWLEAAIPQEKAEVRAELLGGLEVSLGSADEPFLERMLDDRSAQVRAVASALLARLPDSALAGRMRSRCDACVRIQRASPPTGLIARMASRLAGERITLEVDPPPGIDPSWDRDGIASKAPQGVGDRAHRLAELLALVPPSRWQESSGLAPADIIDRARGDEWVGALLSGWSRAALLHRTANWMAPLGAALAALPGDAWPEPLRSEIEIDLIAAMPEDDVYAFAAKAFTDAVRDRVLSAGLDRRRGPWREPFASTFMDGLARCASSDARNRFSGWVARAALRLPRDQFARALTIGEVADATEYPEQTFNRSLGSFQDVIRLRQRLHEEIVP